MTKTLAVAASLTLLAVALAPLGMTHNNQAGSVLPGLPGKRVDGANRVSGVYYKDSSLMLLVASFNDLDTMETLAHNYNRCDMEVLSDGTTSGSNLDEKEVDNADSNNPVTSPAGTAEWDPVGNSDTLFDDGGVGAVCHTHTGYYAYGPYNTPGCNYDSAFAQDSAAQDVWITTTCDYGQATSGVDLGAYILSCAKSNLLTNDVNGLVLCSTTLLACFTSKGINCPLDVGMACGPDAAGSGGVQTAGQSGWGNYGVGFDYVPAPCDNDDGAASVFVWTAVFVDALNCRCVEESLPTIGVIY